LCCIQDNWNTKGSLYDIPYNLSKTVAEKKAWELAEQATHW
jgi:dihydroflavonol-4-reductase